jgi:hypothetical protein
VELRCWWSERWKNEVHAIGKSKYQVAAEMADRILLDTERRDGSSVRLHDYLPAVRKAIVTLDGGIAPP